jgi:uncharacterized membrane protein
MGMIGVIIAVIVVVVILLVVMMILKSKKGKESEHDKEAIAEMEAKIERAKKLGLPTGELERLLKEAKEGKPLSVEPLKEKKGKGSTGRKGKGKR